MEGFLEKKADNWFRGYMTKYVIIKNKSLSYYNIVKKNKVKPSEAKVDGYINFDLYKTSA